jgi:hypothetical protein
MRFERNVKKIILGVLGFVFAGSISAGILGPFALFSVPQGIKGLIAAKEFAQIKIELVKLLPGILILFSFFIFALFLIFVIYLIRRCADVNHFYSKRRIRRFKVLLQGVLLDLKLGKDLTSSPLIEEVRKMSHSLFIRRRLQKVNFNGVQECLERIVNSELGREERGEIVRYLIGMIQSVD